MNSQSRDAVAGSKSIADNDAKQAHREVPDANASSGNSILSSGGAIGKQFNATGSLGSIPQSIGGPLDKDGAIGSIFNAEHEGVAGKVEKLVGGPQKQ